MARRRRGRANPDTGLWIALAAGIVAVGGVAYVMTRPSTATAAGSTPATPSYAAITNATPGAPVTQAQIAAVLSNPPPPAGTAQAIVVTDAIARAVALAEGGQTAAGVYWANLARTNGASAAQSAELTTAGY